MVKLNPNKPMQTQRLIKAAEHSRRVLLPFRENLLRFTKQYAGSNYSYNASGKKVYLNYMELQAGIFIKLLVGGKPQNLITTPIQRLKLQALDFEADQNHLLNEINFESTIHEYVMNALFMLGIIKTGITEGLQGEIDGFLHDAGQPFADNIDFSDWVHDTNVTRYEQVQFAGNRYSLPVEYLLGSDLYKLSDSVIMGMETSQTNPYNETGEEKQKTISIGTEQVSSIDQFHKQVELWDFWLPREQLVLTFLSDETSGVSHIKPIRIVEWEGGEEGPYHLLSFNKVPGNMMPLSPMSLMMDLHLLANQIFRKLARQAERQKEVGFARGGNDKGIENIIKANDGDWIRDDAPKEANVQKFGGPDPSLSAFVLMVQDEAYSIPGGNLAVIGGLSSEADTLGQEQILDTRASRRLESMQEQTWLATEGIMKALAKYNWYNPIRDVKINRRIPNTTLEVPVRHAPELREGDFFDFNFELSPFSMTNRTPASKLQTITNTLERIVAPFEPSLREQGLEVDLRATIKLIAKYSNTPELVDLFKTATGPLESDDNEKTGSDRVRQAPVTTRNYVRKNQSTSTQSGRSDVMQRLFAGGAVQGSEVAKLGGTG